MLRQGGPNHIQGGNAVTSSGGAGNNGGPSLLLSQLAKQTTSDPNPELINKVATCHASKVPNDSLHPLINQPQIKQETEIKTEDQIKTEIKEEPMENNEQEIKQEPVKIKTEIVKTEVKQEVAKSEPPVVHKPCKVVFSKEDLQNALLPPLMKMYNQEPEASPFREPVNPESLGIPDYFNIIKNPMDMSTIKGKLDTGEYKEPWEFVDDVWLMFENAWKYNRKTSRVYKYCTKVNPILPRFPTFYSSYL